MTAASVGTGGGGWPPATRGRGGVGAGPGGLGGAGRAGAAPTGGWRGPVAAGCAGRPGGRRAVGQRGGGPAGGNGGGGSGGAASLQGFHVQAPGERPVPCTRGAGMVGRTPVRGREPWRHVADRRAALLRRGGGPGVGAGCADEGGVRAAGGESGARVRCDGRDRVSVSTGAGVGVPAGRELSDRVRSSARRGAGGPERHEPYPRQLLR